MNPNKIITQLNRYSFYEYVKKENIDTYKGIIKKVQQNSITNVFEIIFNCYLLSLNLENDLITDNFFDFSASKTLSGEPYPCGDISHRLQIVKELMTFCVLYSDTISIVNPLEFVYSYIKGKSNLSNKNDEEIFIKKTVDALLIMIEMKEMIELKKIVFAKLNFTACKNHLKEINKDQIKMGDDLFDFASKRIAPKLIKEIKLIFKRPDYVIAKGLNNFFDENNVVTKFKKLPNEYKKYLKYSQFTLPKKDVKEYVDSYLMNEAVNTIMMHYGPITLENKRTYLTSNQIETDLLNYLKDKNDNANYSHNIVNGLNHLAPFIEGGNLKKIINFRRKENKAFENYRDSIKNALKETSNCKTQVEFEEALQDIIKPQLDKLEFVFKQKQDEIMNMNIKGGLSCLISIGLGLATKNIDILNSGLITGACTSAGCIYKQHKLQTDLKENNYYFLWKIKKTL